FSGGAAPAEADKGLFLTGTLSGTGPITIQHTRIGTGNAFNTSFVDIANNGNTYSGTITVNENTTVNEGGVYLGISGSTALANATVVISSNISGTAQQFGSSPIVFNSDGGAVPGIGSAAVFGALSGSG